MNSKIDFRRRTKSIMSNTEHIDMASENANPQTNEMSPDEDEGRRSPTEYNSVESLVLHSLVLLTRIKKYEGEPLGPDYFTQDSVWELCRGCNPGFEPCGVEILSPQEACLSYWRDIILGAVAGNLMSVKNWMGFPIVITVVIMNRARVDTVVEARQKHRALQKAKAQQGIDQVIQGQDAMKE